MLDICNMTPCILVNKY